MKYEDKLQMIIDYFKKHEKTSDNLKLGPEYEHIMVDRSDYKSISYYGERGVNAIMKRLEESGWEGSYEGEHLLALTKDGMNVTTEPGGQFEFSSTQKADVRELEEVYIKFFNELLPILDEYEYDLLGIGYHPVTEIEDIKLLPKFRYDSMFDYFKTHGTMGHNMMKGTAALQLSIDYTDEADYAKKYFVASALSNIIYSMMENAYFFQGGVAPWHNVRAKIWENTDKDRSGLVKYAFDEDFSYEAYAKYLLETKSVFAYVDGEFAYTGEKTIEELINENTTEEELEHLMTMVFPDVRTKKFIELRMADAVPYPLNFAYYAMVKGLLYNEDNLNELAEYFKGVSYDDMMETRESMYSLGREAIFMGKSLYEHQKYVVGLAAKGLSESEGIYLEPLMEMVSENTSPYEITKSKYSDNVKDAVSWCRIAIEEEVNVQ